MLKILNSQILFLQQVVKNAIFFSKKNVVFEPDEQFQLFCDGLTKQAFHVKFRGIRDLNPVFESYVKWK